MANIFATAFGQWFITIMFILLAVVFIVFYIKKFKHKVRIREVMGDRMFIRDDKAREIKDADGVVWWKLLWKRDKVPVPPPQAVDVTAKGVKCAECYWTEEGGYRWIEDKAKQEEINFIPPTEEETKEKPTISTFQPLTTNQRLISINQYRKAETRKKKNTLEMVIQMLPIMAFIILVIIMFAFWKEIWEPALQMSATADQITAGQIEITSEQAKITALLHNILVKSDLNIPIEAPD